MTLITLVLLFGITAGDSKYLKVSDIRLAGGSGPYGGRVEINVKGVWGTVCDDEFNMKTAEVMCRMMHLKPTAYVRGGYFGNGSGPIFAQRFYCDGYESSLNYCYYVDNSLCTHARDVGIICTDISDIRLVDGVGIADGRVEILVNGSWGTICSTSFRWSELQTVCRMLGFHYIWKSDYIRDLSVYGKGKGPIFLSNLQCSYSDSDINECTYSNVHTCSHSQDIAVKCHVSDLNVTNVRLNPGPLHGRVEIPVHGAWGTVCQTNSYRISYGIGYAETLCHLMNSRYSLASVLTTPEDDTVNGSIILKDLSCSGKYSSIRSCDYYMASYICKHGQDLSLSYFACGIPPNIVEDTVVINGTKLTAECFPGFSPRTVTMNCQTNKQWDTGCKQITVYPLDISDISLIDNNGYSLPSAGLVRILVNGTWGGVCRNNFDANDAAVICRMMDLEYLSYSLNSRLAGTSDYGRDKMPIFIDNLNCFGNETHINECTYDTGDSCIYWEDVAVKCKSSYHLNITDIRLSGGSSLYTGRVEILVNGTWGTISDEYFYSTEASVICLMLGLSRSYTYYHNAYYGRGTGPIYINNLDCDYGSYYNHINRCKYASNNYYNRSHGDDVSVTCFGPPLNITGARLVNGSGPNEGRAEIQVDGVWGTICNLKFDLHAADLFCKLLNARVVNYTGGAKHGPGTGPIYLEKIYCSSSDVRLSDCNYLHLNSCTHNGDVSITCGACGKPDLSIWDDDFFKYNGSELYADCAYYGKYVGTLRMKCNDSSGEWFLTGRCSEYDVRLSGGRNHSTGRVEIKSQGTWRTVCNNSFGCLKQKLCAVL